MNFEFSKRITLSENNFFSAQIFSMKRLLLILFLLIARLMNLYFADTLLLFRFGIEDLNMALSVDHLRVFSMCSCRLRPATFSWATNSVSIWSQIVTWIDLRNLHTVRMSGSILVDLSVSHRSIDDLMPTSALISIWGLIQTRWS